MRVIKNVSKPATKPAASTKPVKPDVKQTSAKPALSSLATERATAHAVAAQAVAAFYTGASKPFKAAGDVFKPLRDRAGETSTLTDRQAALTLALYTYSAGNITPDGTCKRGEFRVPARLVFDAAELRKRNIDPNATLRAQPESGCLGRLLGHGIVRLVSGPKSGADQRDQILRFNHDKARNAIQTTFGDKRAAIVDAVIAGTSVSPKAATKLVKRVAKPAATKPAKPVAAPSDASSSVPATSTSVVTLPDVPTVTTDVPTVA